MFSSSNENTARSIDKDALPLQFDIQYGQGAWRSPALSYERDLWQMAWDASERQAQALYRTDLEATRVFSMATKAGFTVDKAGNYICTAAQLLTIARELRLAEAPAAHAQSIRSHWAETANDENEIITDQPR